MWIDISWSYFLFARFFLILNTGIGRTRNLQVKIFTVSLNNSYSINTKELNGNQAFMLISYANPRDEYGKKVFNGFILRLKNALTAFSSTEIDDADT